ncbi:tyrosine phosphatase [Oryctes borbonicus]|uniref:protein-tyrosine-phosphatase n=1 Tax=Oryctes borbonicus TaxID=1629725 RepID=A0A0T6BF57_9SCAR|nr:tyrosine phosphatase [Oryctes borbonicus]
MAMKLGKVDVYNQCYNLRKQQANMMDNASYYKLVHLVVILCTVAPDYTIECTEQMEAKVEEMTSSAKLFDQMIYIEDTVWHDDAARNTYARVTEPIIHNRNRYKNILPDAYARIILKPLLPTDLTSSYINAIKVNGFCASSKFIVTQYPLPHTLEDFWRLVEQHHISTIICLNELDLSDKTCCKFYPSSDRPMAPMPHTILECTDVIEGNYYNISTLNLIYPSEMAKCKEIKLLHVNNWTYSMLHPRTPAQLLAVYDQMDILTRSSTPILVTCLDGAHASGLYTSMSCVVDKIKMEHVCDVCLAVRIVKRSRGEFVRRPEQFAFLYKCAYEYVCQLSNYSNFFIKK